MHSTRHKRKEVSCGTLTVRFFDDRIAEVLLIRQSKDNDKWGIPKGHIEPGESYYDCALRETFEETGVIVDVVKRLPDLYYTTSSLSKTIVNFLAIGHDEPITTHESCEVADAKWFNVNYLPPLVAYQEQHIKKYVEVVTRDTYGDENEQV